VTFKTIVKSGARFLEACLYKFIVIFVSIAGNLLISRLLGIELNLLVLSSIILIVDLVVLLPISFSGIGIRDISFIGLFGLFGVSMEKAVLLSFSILIIHLVIIGIGGILLLIKDTPMIKNLMVN